jgi:hypothetical protein
VIHLCPIQVNNTQYLAALSEKVLTIYNFKWISVLAHSLSYSHSW